VTVELTIRPATADDDRASQRLEVLTMTGEVSPAPARPPDAPFFTGSRQPGDLLVAEVAGTAVGHVELEQQLWAPSHAHVRTVGGLAADPAPRGWRERPGTARGGHRRGPRARRAGADAAGPRPEPPGEVAPRALRVRGRGRAPPCSAGEFVIDGRDVDDVLMARDSS